MSSPANNPTASGAVAPVVFERDGAPWTNSRDVAGLFDKHHNHVLRDIDNLLASLPPQKSKGGSHHPKLDGVYFQELRADHPTVPGRQDRSFDMTRDGFTLLAMGFTGAEALNFKIAYIARFNAMEAELRTRAATHQAISSKDWRAWISIAESAGRLYGPAAARQVWASSPLPQVENEPWAAARPFDRFSASCTRRKDHASTPADGLFAAYSDWLRTRRTDDD